MTVHDLEVVALVQSDLSLSLGICDHHAVDVIKVAELKSTAMARFGEEVERLTGLHIAPRHLVISADGRDSDDAHVTRHTVRWAPPLANCSVELRGGELDGALVTVDQVDGLIQVDRRMPPFDSFLYEITGWSDSSHAWVADATGECPTEVGDSGSGRD